MVKKNSRSPRVQSKLNCQVLELLENDAAVTVADRLRQPGGAGGEQYPQRMIERHLLELELGRAAPADV